jgi:SPP1 family predicted phage head-tail adaptor
MLSGPLRHSVTLQSKTHAQSSTGATTVTWTDEATVFASISPISGREFFKADAVQSDVRVRVVLRYGSEIAGIDTSWRVKPGAVKYDIKSVVNHRERNHMLTLMCAEGVTDDE